MDFLLGMVIMADGSKILLDIDQILTADGLPQAA